MRHNPLTMKYLLVITMSAFLSITAKASDFPDDLGFKSLFRIDSDSGIKGPPYQKIVDELKELESTFPEIVNVIEYGRSVGGRPLTIVKIQKKLTIEGKLPAIYIGGSIHGDEYLNIEDRLPKWFAEQSEQKGPVGNFLEKGGVIYIAPILNPDGYEKRSRTNDLGIDLNRDFTVIEAQVEGLKQPETSALAFFLEEDLKKEGRKLEITMDYHCCIGALLYPWSFKGPTLPSEQLIKHLNIVEAMKSTVGGEIKSGTTPTILGYSAKGTSKDFYYEHFGATSFTFEGRRNREDKYFDEHTKMWDLILQRFEFTSI